MIVASYLFGATLWGWSAFVTYTLWGRAGLLIGLALGGVGVVPLAMLATLLSGMWSQCGALALMLTMTFAIRFWGFRRLQLARRRTMPA